MVDFSLPETLSDQFIATIPHQREAITKLFAESKLLTYALSLETARLWAVFNVASEVELLEIISDLPLSRYLRAHISELTFYDASIPFPTVFSNS